MTTINITILPGPVARCADIAIGLLGMVEILGSERHQVAPGSLQDRNLQDALRSLSSAHAALNSTSLIDALAANEARRAEPIDARNGMPH